jgi:hypothetical protein
VTNSDIATRRLRNQRLSAAGVRQPEDVVAWFGAVQAQEFEPALWGLGLRMRSSGAAAVFEAFNEGRLLRTHAMRPTWHFVTPADIRWIQTLTAPQVKRMMATYNRALELDSAVFTKASNVIAKALRDGQHLTRTELGERLADAGIQAKGPRLAHIMMNAELDCLVCSGPKVGKQSTYALLDHRAPGGRTLPHDEALATLVGRFFQSHGPATVRDCVWWSGLKTADVKRGLDMIKARREVVNDVEYWTTGQLSRSPARDHAAHLLPIYDEYVVAYRDRIAVPHGPPKVKRVRPAVVFQHALIIGGQIAGTWRITKRVSGPVVTPTPIRRLNAAERECVADAVSRHQTFTAAR